MSIASRITAIVLAAGRSSRMGCPKVLLPFGGQPALDRVLTACRRGGVDDVNLILGEYADRIQREANVTDSRVVLNPDPASGMSASIRMGLESLSRDAGAFMIFPADHPLVPARVVRRLIEVYRQRPSGKRIFAPTYSGRRGHPVLFHAAFKKEFLALRPDEPAHNVIRAHASQVLEVPVDTPFVTTDMDTPEDYIELREAYCRTDVI